MPSLYVAQQPYYFMNWDTEKRNITHFEPRVLQKSVKTAAQASGFRFLLFLPRAFLCPFPLQPELSERFIRDSTCRTLTCVHVWIICTDGMRWRWLNPSLGQWKCHVDLKIPVGSLGLQWWMNVLVKVLLKVVCECKCSIMYYSIALLRTSDLRGRLFRLGFEEFSLHTPWIYSALRLMTGVGPRWSKNISTAFWPDPCDLHSPSLLIKLHPRGFSASCQTR